MARVPKKLIKLGTASDEVSASDVPSNFGSPSNYTPDSADIKGHLSGIDTAIGAIGSTTGDIAHTSFSLANNQSVAANVTGLAFANGTVRSARVNYSVTVDATSDLYEAGILELVQRGSDWNIARRTSGDDSLVDFDVTTSGQVQYTTPAYSGFVSATIKFRAEVTQI